MDEGDHARLDVTLTVRARRTARVLPGPDHPICRQQLRPAHRRECRVGRATRAARNAGRQDAAAAANTCSSARSPRARRSRSTGRRPMRTRWNSLRATHDVAGAGVLEGHRYVASGFWHGATLADDDPLAAPPGTLVALGQSGPEQVYLRALSMDGYALSETVQPRSTGSTAPGTRPRFLFRRFTS